MREPVTLFGERAEDRRDRLRSVLAALDARDGGELEEGGRAARTRTRTRRWVGRETSARGVYTEGRVRCRGEDRGGGFSLPRAARRNDLARARRPAAAAGRRRRETSERRGWTRRWRRRRSFRRSVRRSVTLSTGVGCSFSTRSSAASANWSEAAVDVRRERKATSDLVIRATDHRITGVDAAASLLATSHADGTAAIRMRRRLSRREFKGHAAGAERFVFTA